MLLNRRSVAILVCALCVPLLRPSAAAAGTPPAEAPALKWVRGTLTQMLVQPKENYYVFTLRDTDGTTTLIRLCDPATGAVSPVKADDPLYDVLRESFFRGRKVQAGVRDFGHDPQSGSPKICVDRVSLYR
jgi:hypothetical protein